MYSLEEKHFATFHQPYFSFKVLKETKTPEEIDALKTVFKQTWTDFKAWQLEAASLTLLPFSKLRVESWTNGWNLRNHFWCPYRHIDKTTDSPCLAVLLDGEKLMIYLMYQHYKSENSTITVADYNQKHIDLLPWYQKEKLSLPLYFWPNQKEDLKDFTSLANEKDLQQVLSHFDFTSKEETFCLGYVLTSPQNNIPELISQALQNLYPIYEKIVLP